MGPLVVAVVGVDPRQIDALRALGVQDSKRFGSGAKAVAKRRELAAAIATVCPVGITLADAGQVDAAVKVQGLNRLERDLAKMLLESLQVPLNAQVIADGELVFKPLASTYARLQAVNHGEDAHIAVAAASICAKDLRDTAMEQIYAKYTPTYGQISGGGYGTKATYAFLAAYKAAEGDYPVEARRTWLSK